MQPKEYGVAILYKNNPSTYSWVSCEYYYPPGDDDTCGALSIFVQRAAAGELSPEQLQSESSASITLHEVRVSLLSQCC